MNNLDKQYQNLLQDIFENGTTKKDRTGTGTISVFGRQIRHKMSEGFPLLTTKKMAFKGIATELIWFLNGDTNIKYLVDNGCNIWNGDCYSNYLKKRNSFYNKDNIKEDVVINGMNGSSNRPYTMKEFINKIKTDNEFAQKWGDLGPIYGKQWRQWQGWMHYEGKDGKLGFGSLWYDQIARLIHDLKTNPDSRRLMVNAWNVAEIDQMVLPPCHYGFQVYTRELSEEERWRIRFDYYPKDKQFPWDRMALPSHRFLDDFNIPTRAISLMWNQRSVDTFLGLPFNIASYGLLLEIIAKSVNMVPDELIGNLGDVHLYSNHVEQAKEQIGRDLTLEERRAMVTQEMFNQIYNGGGSESLSHSEIDQWGIPKRTREPYPLTRLLFKDHLSDFKSLLTKDNVILRPNDFVLDDYKYHPKIEAPLSN